MALKMSMLKRALAIVLCGGLMVGAVLAGPMEEIVQGLDLAELAATFDEAKTARILGSPSSAITAPEERAAAATLVTMGVLRDGAWDDPDQVARMLRGWDQPANQTVSVLEIPLARPVGILRVGRFGGHETLRSDTALMAALDAAIGEGVLTGYGLRPRGVSAATRADRTVIYSHSSLPHVKQLIGLMASEGLKGRVFLAPKIAAFVFRDGWGERPKWVNELGPGIHVAQGPEMLVHFELARPADRQRFDELVDQYAKKDAAEETGNLIRSWWQPFYYCETAAEGYQQISRVTLFGETVEASLLMLPAMAEGVQRHFAGTPWEMRVDSIWVSAPFFRFLEGDFK